MIPKPLALPARPFFSSGPTVKPPGWKVDDLSQAMVGRDHRSPDVVDRVRQLLERMRRILEIPKDFTLLLTPASASGAFETALWGLLGPRPVTALAWEKFGQLWADDIQHQLKIPNSRCIAARQCGELPSLQGIDPTDDLVFVWNGTPVGVAVPNGEWINAPRDGLVLCDATSAAFMMRLPWDRLDAVAFSWQKALGGEAQHGMLALSGRARRRWLEESPASGRAVPRVLRACFDTDGGTGVEKDGGMDGSSFIAPVNTISLLAVEDAAICLDWVEAQGGLQALCQRSWDNQRIIHDWVERTAWVDFLARDPATRPPAPVCVKVVHKNQDWVERLCRRLREEGAAYDITAHPQAPTGLRIWTGPTVDRQDLVLLTQWLDWAHDAIGDV